MPDTRMSQLVKAGDAIDGLTKTVSAYDLFYRARYRAHTSRAEVELGMDVFAASTAAHWKATSDAHKKWWQDKADEMNEKMMAWRATGERALVRRTKSLCMDDAAGGGLNKDVFGVVVSFLPWREQFRVAGAASREARASLSDATFRLATAVRYGADAFPGATAREAWAIGARLTRGDFELGKLDLPPKAAVLEYSGGTAMASNANVVAFAGEDDGSKLILRSAADLNVLAVHDGFESVWALAIFGKDVIAWTTGARDCRLHLMHAHTPGSYTVEQTPDDITTLAGSPDGLLVRGFLGFQVWQARVGRGEIIARCAYEQELRVQMRTCAATWAPALGESETQDILVTYQPEKFGPARIWRGFIDENDADPALSNLTMLRISPVVARSSPHQASRYPYASIAASHKYVAAVTMQDLDGLYYEEFGIETPRMIVNPELPTPLLPRYHVFDADLKLLCDVAEPLSLQNSGYMSSEGVHIALVGSLLLSSSVRGLAICAWDCPTGHYLYRYDGFFTHPNGYAVPCDVDIHPTCMAHPQNITAMAFVAGNAALALGCFGGFHVLLDATPRRASWIRDAIAEARLPREFMAPLVASWLGLPDDHESLLAAP